jgi:iron complex transport system substrate-binding protein
MFPPERIICLTEETVETLYLLGEQDRIVGISGFVARPPQARREKPRVSAFTSANINKILALEPRLILTFSDLQANIPADLIRRGLDVQKRDLDIVAALGRAFGHTNMGVYAEVVAGGETAVGDALLMKSGV